MKKLDDIQEETLRQVKATKHYVKQIANTLELALEWKGKDRTDGTLSTILSILTEMNMRQRQLELEVTSIRQKVDKLEH